MTLSTHTKHLVALLGAVLFASMLLFIAITQYQSLTPKPIASSSVLDTFTIPILPGDPILGDVRAQRTVIAFEDYACTSCQQQHQLLNQVLEKYPQRIKIVWKGLPINQFPHDSRDAQIRAYCYEAQDLFEDFHTLAFINADALSVAILEQIDEQIDGVNQSALQNCIDSPEAQAYISQNELIARALQIQQVPTFFIDNQQIQPPQSLEGWEAVLGL